MFHVSRHHGHGGIDMDLVAYSFLVGWCDGPPRVGALVAQVSPRAALKAAEDKAAAEEKRDKEANGREGCR